MIGTPDREVLRIMWRDVVKGAKVTVKIVAGIVAILIVAYLIGLSLLNAGVYLFGKEPVGDGLVAIFALGLAGSLVVAVFLNILLSWHESAKERAAGD